MIDVILIFAVITGLTIVALRYGRRLLALGGMVLAWALAGTSREDGEEDFVDEVNLIDKRLTDRHLNDPLYSGLICNIYHDDREDW